MVTTFYPPYHFGGDALYVYRLSQALARAGHHVDVIHSTDAYRLQRSEEPAVEFEEHPRVRRHALATSHPKLSALLAHQLGRPGLYERRLRALLEDPAYDVIHFHNVSLLGAPGLLALGRAAKVYTAHEYWLICPTHVLFAFDREACTKRRCLPCTLRYRRPPQAWRYLGGLEAGLAHVDCVLAPSRFALERHRAEGITRPLVHLPYLVPEAPHAEKAAPSPHVPYFLYVGRLEKLKGVQDLLRLFASYRGADLLVAGDGSYAAPLREQAQGLGHVRFLGHVHPEVLSTLYRGALAVLVPSLCYETFGLAAAEAMSHGTPAIVRRIGALAELMDECGGGFSFETLEQCRAAMERLRLDPALRSELGARGREAVNARCRADVHVGQYLKIVRSTLATRLEHRADGAQA